MSKNILLLITFMVALTTTSVVCAASAQPEATPTPESKETQKTKETKETKRRDWYVTAMINGWLSGTSGSVKTPNRQVDVDVSFEDILQNLDGALIGRLEGGYKDFAFMLDGTYMKTTSYGGRSFGNFFTQDQVTSKQSLLDFGAYYLLFGERPLMRDGWYFGLEPFLGGRYIGLDVDAFHTGPLTNFSLAYEKDMVLPLLGLRLSADLIGNLFIQAEGQVGGFGAYDCDLTWTGSAMLGYGFFKTVVVAAGYKAVGIDYNDDFSQSPVAVDIVYHGPVLAFGVHF